MLLVYYPLNHFLTFALIYTLTHLFLLAGRSKGDEMPGDIFTGSFSGLVTTENNGGFSGIRSFNFLKNAEKNEGILIECTGDGNRYKFIARDNDLFNGIAWYTSNYSRYCSLNHLHDTHLGLTPLILKKMQKH